MAHGRRMAPFPACIPGVVCAPQAGMRDRPKAQRAAGGREVGRGAWCGRPRPVSAVQACMTSAARLQDTREWALHAFAQCRRRRRLQVQGAGDWAALPCDLLQHVLLLLSLRDRVAATSACKARRCQLHRGWVCWVEPARAAPAAGLFGITWQPV